MVDSHISVHSWEVVYEAEPPETAPWLGHQEDTDVTHGQQPAALAVWFSLGAHTQDLLTKTV